MTVDEILEYLLANVPDNYDISPGSFFYDILYPVAVQIHLLNNSIDNLSDKAFVQTSVGEYLDRKVIEQGITRKPAEYASGTVRITGARGEIVRVGAKLAADNILFAVDEQATIPECGYIDVTATCTIAGSIGNVKAGKINRFPVTLPGLTAVTNITDFSGGYDAEPDEELRERYFEKVSRPNVSGNKYNYIEWAKEVGGVGDVQVIPLWNGNGTVKVVIIDSDHQPANDELIEKVRAHIEENRPIGADVTVVSAEAIQIDISVTLNAVESETIKCDIENSIQTYLSDDALTKSYVSYAKIGSILLSVNGIEDYSNLQINNSTSNIDIADGAVPILGNVVIEYA